MNELIGKNDSRKRVLGFMASLLACFALVMALVPVQAIAAGADEGTGTEATEQEGNTEGAGSEGAEEGDENPGDADETEKADPIEIAVPATSTNLTYTGVAQKVLPKNEGYTVTLVTEEGQEQAVDDKSDATAILATNAGTYTFNVVLNEGYLWQGGGAADQTVKATIAPADIKKSTTIKAPKYATFMGDPVTIEIIITSANKQTLVEGEDYTVRYAGNDEVGTASAVIDGIGNYQGMDVVQFEVVETQTMYRAYNPNSGEHFYTASTKERDALVKAGWRDEGIAWTAPKKSDTPVYRLYSGTDHHYTTSTKERDALVKAGWKDEGIGWYSENTRTVDTEMNIPLYRVFNPNVDPTAATNNSGSHHYTTSTVERDSLIKAGWRDEGTGWYAAKAAEKAEK